MTSEPDSKPGRRPPTIELKATEVEQPESTAPSGEAAAPDTPATERRAPASPSPPAKPGAGRGLKSHAVGAIVGALVMAAIVAGLWLAGFVPSREAAAPPPAAAPATSAAMHAAPSNDRHLGAARQDRTRDPGAAAEPALGNRLAAAEAQPKSLGDSLAALSRRLDDIAGSQAQSARAKQANAAAAAGRSAGSK